MMTLENFQAALAGTRNEWIIEELSEQLSSEVG